MDAIAFKKLTNWEKVRALSGIIPQSGDEKQNNAILTQRLALICLISRVEAGDSSEVILHNIIEKLFGEEQKE
jgi:hypothetical protein